MTGKRQFRRVFIAFITAMLISLVQSARPVFADPIYDWAIGTYGTGSAWGEAIALDPAGNVYTTGHFSGTVDFDPGPGVANLTATSISDDIYVSKFDNNGNYLWAISFGGSGTYNHGYDITVDAASNVYVTGDFHGTFDFDPGPGVANLTSAGGADVFVLKLDTNGNYLWARNMGGTAADEGLGITFDSAGNVYTIGNFYQTADFDPGPGTANLTSTGNQDVFISKLDVNGNYLWAGNVGGTGFDRGYDIAVDAAGNIYTTGGVSDSGDFDPGPGVATLTTPGGDDIFISKLDTNGNYLWAGNVGGVSSAWAEDGRGITVDSAGNMYIAGWYGSDGDFDPGPGTAILTNSGRSDIVVLKLDTNGNYLWAAGMGGTFFQSGYDIALDNSGNVYTTGFFNGTVDFDPGPGTQNLTTAGGWDIFISKLDNNGNYLWAGQMGSNVNDEGLGIAVDGVDSIYTTGHFALTGDFDPGPGPANLTSGGGWEAFVSKLQAAPEIDVQRPAGTSIPDGGADAVGTVPVGLTTLTYTIENTGTGTLTIPAGGVTASNFTPNISSFTVNTDLPLTVPAGTTATLQIQFNISAPGAFSFDLDIANNDTDENPYDIDVSGTAVATTSEIDVQRPAGTSIPDGGNDAVGSQPVGPMTLTYTIDNTAGTGALTIPAGGVTASNLTNVSGFTVNTGLPLTVAAGATSTLQIQFNIDAAGAFSFDLDITNNDTDENPYDIAVSGTGTGTPEIDVQRPAGTSIADGGNDLVGAQLVGPLTLTYTIENTGSGPLTIPVGGVTTSNLTNVSGFTVNTGLPLTVAAGATSTLQIQFNIDAAGAFSFDLDIANDDADENPYDIAVSGTGTDNLVAAADCNGNDLDVTITSGDPNFDITGGGSGLPLSGVGTGTYTLTGPDTWTGVTVTELTGDTESANLGDFTCGPEIDVQRPAGTSITDGGNDLVGTQPVGLTTLTYTIQNTGSGPLTIPVGGVTASNLTNVSGFTVDTGLPLTVAAGNTATLQIQFNIDAAGAFSLDLDIDNNDTNENPYDIAVSGTGTNNLMAAAACNGDDLEVNITSGDNPFDITGAGPNLPQNGVGTGITILAGPGSWTGVTVSETVGDMESANLGNYTCPPAAPPPSGGGDGAAQVQAVGCNVTIDVEADREVVNWGDRVLWTVLIRNPGPDECQGVRTYGTMPGEFAITDINTTRGSINWDGGQYYLVELGTMVVSDQVTVTLDSLLQGGAGFTLPEGAVGQSAGQQICLTGYISEPVNDTDCVTLFPDTLPATGGEPVKARVWWWTIGSMIALGGGLWAIRRWRAYSG